MTRADPDQGAPDIAKKLAELKEVGFVAYGFLQGLPKELRVRADPILEMLANNLWPLGGA